MKIFIHAGKEQISAMSFWLYLKIRSALKANGTRLTIFWCRYFQKIRAVFHWYTTDTVKN